MRPLPRGDWRAGYVVLDVDKADLKIDFLRVEYAVDTAASAIRASTLPDEFADYLLARGKLAPAASDQNAEAG